MSSVKEHKHKITIEGDVQLTKRLNFNVGEEFVYKQNILFAGVMQNLTQRYKIIGIEKRKGIECYKILWAYENPVMSIEEMFNPTTGEKKTLSKIEIEKINGTIFVSLDNGSFVDVLIDNESILEREDFRVKTVRSMMYAPWMLYLDNGKEFEIKDEERGETIIYHFKVAGREKVEDRNCFKVEVTIYELPKNGNLKKINVKAIHWIDEEKRIVIKEEDYEGKLETGEMSLLNAI